MLSISQFVRPSVCVSVCSLFEVPFNGLFAPTSRSRMSNIFRDSESLGKSNGKKWSQKWTFLVWKLSKIAAQKKSFFLHFFSVFFGFRYFLTVFLPPFPEVGCPIFLVIRNPWGNVIERSGLRYEIFLFENCLKSPRKKKGFFLHFFTFEVPFNGLFAPTFQSRMSNIFRDTESLRKSNGKKWSTIWTFYFGSGLKSPRKKVFFCCWFCLGPPSYGIGATIRIGREMLCLPYAGFFFISAEKGD